MFAAKKITELLFYFEPVLIKYLFC